MCGICGIVGGRPECVDHMMATIIHRGPDAAGSVKRPPMAVGMRRLSIIDLSGGDQPIFNEVGSVAVVFNGEIYNFRDLRRELEELGHQFSTRSDTEVIVHGYEQWGDDVVERLFGMFAFAVVDTRRRRLFLARDRFGKKPLYYRSEGEELIFASEIKALLAAGATPELDEAMLGSFLALRYVPAPGTLFRNIRQLPAGHLGVFEEGIFSVRRWWRLEYGPKHSTTLREASLQVEQLMRTAVTRRLVSDVPLGCFLSGGLDSSMVLSFMAEASDQPVRTFSIGFDPDWPKDELDAARATARAFGARHREIRIGPREALDLLPTAIWHRDEPLAEPSEIPLLALSQMAREDVTVVLSGEGGDELFAGYPKYRVDRVLARAGGATRAILGVSTLRHLAELPWLGRRGRLMLAALALRDPEDRWPGWFGADRLSALWGAGERPLGAQLASRNGENLGLLDRQLCLDVESYLVDNLLVRGDKMTMAASLESRMPLLDHELAEAVARMPEGLKATPRQGKIIMREIARHRLPQDLLERPKIGFAVPVDSWFRNELGLVLQALLDQGGPLENMLPRDSARALLASHRGRGFDFGKELWSLLCLEVWARIFLEGHDPGALDLRSLASGR